MVKRHCRSEQLLQVQDSGLSENHRAKYGFRYHADSSNCMIFRTQELNERVCTSEIGLFKNKLLDDLQFFFSTTYISK